jgi:hypothetical protein
VEMFGKVAKVGEERGELGHGAMVHSRHAIGMAMLPSFLGLLCSGLGERGPGNKVRSSGGQNWARHYLEIVKIDLG